MMATRLGVTIEPGHLVTLHALLEERHVTRAAARLGITQSSMSHRLGRLRVALGDPLFVRSGARLLPTARAEALAGPLAGALAALEAVVAPPDAFDPTTSRATLTLALPDLLAPAIGPILAAVAAQAPHLRITCVAVAPGLSEWLAAGPPSLALVPRRFLGEGLMSRALGELRFGVAARRGHPALRRAWTVEQWLAHSHVVVRTGNDAGNPIDEALRRRGYERRIGLEVPSFLMGLMAVASSDLLMNVPLPLARRATQLLALAVRPAPVELPAVSFVMAWHPRLQHDPAHAWLREQLAASMVRDFVAARAPGEPRRDRGPGGRARQQIKSSRL